MTTWLPSGEAREEWTGDGFLLTEAEEPLLTRGGLPLLVQPQTQAWIAATPTAEVWT